MNTLSERLERAIEVRREFDAEIAKEVGLLTCFHSKHGHFVFHFCDVPYSTFNNLHEETRNEWPSDLIAAIDAAGVDIPAYTTSIDAAMALAVKLLDKGAVDIEVAHRTTGGISHARAEILGPHVDQLARARTPAIALCICILRAHAAEENQP